MKTFMSASLDETTPPKSATECNTCSGNGSGAVRTAGQESAEPAPAQKQEPAQDQQKKENAVVVMQGPLGSVITEALNKELSKKSTTSPVQIPTPGNEGYQDYVQANGQIKNPPELVARVTKAVGLVPKTDEAPTAINTLLDCASKVEDIDFIMVGKVESDPNPSQVPQKSILHIVNVDGVPANEEIAIESVQVVVTYTKRPKR